MRLLRGQQCVNDDVCVCVCACDCVSVMMMMMMMSVCICVSVSVFFSHQFLYSCVSTGSVAITPICSLVLRPIPM